MKRFLIITAAVFYLLFNSGLAVNMHFCCGKLVDMAINAPAESCGNPEVPSNEDRVSKNCCKDVHLLLMQEDSKLTSKTVECDFQNIHLVAFLPVSYLAGPHVFHGASMVAYRSHAPPLIGSDLCLVNRVFKL